MCVCAFCPPPLRLVNGRRLVWLALPCSQSVLLLLMSHSQPSLTHSLAHVVSSGVFVVSPPLLLLCVIRSDYINGGNNRITLLPLPLLLPLVSLKCHLGVVVQQKKKQQQQQQLVRLRRRQTTDRRGGRQKKKEEEDRMRSLGL